MTTPQIDLMPFCSRDEMRPVRMRPFNQDGCTIAPDGAIIVRLYSPLPEWEPQKNGPKPPNCAEVYRNFPARNDPRFVPLQGTPTGEEMVTCPQCKGSGAVLTYDPEDGGAMICESCDGEKSIPNMERFPIGVRAIATHLVLKMSRLPELLVAVDYDYGLIDRLVRLQPLPFIFDGGDGLVMPMRKGVGK